MNLPEEILETAILFAGWHDARESATDMGVPAALLPLIDRSLLQRVVERLVRNGCRHLHVILGEHPALVREMLQSGERWGCSITYHYHTDGESLGMLMSRLSLNVDRNYLLADGNVLPAIAEIDATCQTPETAYGITQFWRSEHNLEWSGWGVFSGIWLVSQTNKCNRGMVELAILRDERIKRMYSQEPLVVIKPADLVKAGKQLLTMGAMYDLSLGKANQDGLWIGRNCSIHPASKLIPPLYLSQGVKVGEGAVLGPNAFIGQGVFIDKSAHLTACAVLPYTYVGEGIELNQVVASGHHLVNVQLETSIEVTDRSILCYLPNHGAGSKPEKSFDKALARGLKIVLMPAYFLLRVFFKKPVTKGFFMTDLTEKSSGELRETSIAIAPPLPLAGTPGSLVSHFVNTFYPGLEEVLQGKLKLHGPEIRSRVQVMNLHEGWREIYGYSKCGLLQETLLMANGGITQQTQYAADALAANCKDSRTTLKLVRRYLANVFVDFIEVIVGSHWKKPRMKRVAVRLDNPINHIHEDL